MDVSVRLRPDLELDQVNRLLGPTASAVEAIEWAVREFGDKLVMSTSFGMQSAVLLHMATLVAPDIPVLWIDTGYLHQETYLFARSLTRRLKLNLRVCQSDVSAARMEALHGQLWDNDDDISHRVYGVLRKVEPMNRAIAELGGEALLSGVRRGQTDHRATLERVTYNQAQRYFRVHPLLHWSQEDVDAYIAEHKLPYHPLKRQGYVSIGDTHSSRPKGEGDGDRATRFGGKRQECGLHTEKGNARELDIVRNLLSPAEDIAAAEAADNNNGSPAGAGEEPPPPPAPQFSPIIGSPSSTGGRPPSPLAAGSPPGMARPPSGPPGGRSPPPAAVHGTGTGVEIYGRPSCRFCEAAKRVLAARGISYTWCTLQRYNHKLGALEPEICDGTSCVSRDAVVRRVENAAPGSRPPDTVPQIFRDGEYIGGFTDLCLELKVPKAIMDVALLHIGTSNISGGDGKGWANTWNVTGSLRRVPSVQAVFDFDNDQAGGRAAAAPAASNKAAASPPLPSKG